MSSARIAEARGAGRGCEEGMLIEGSEVGR